MIKTWNHLMEYHSKAMKDKKQEKGKKEFFWEIHPSVRIPGLRPWSFDPIMLFRNIDVIILSMCARTRTTTWIFEENATSSMFFLKDWLSIIKTKKNLINDMWFSLFPLSLAFFQTRCLVQPCESSSRKASEQAIERQAKQSKVFENRREEYFLIYCLSVCVPTTR